MFRVSAEEWDNLKCQIGISSWGGDRQLPYAFTENGIATSAFRTGTTGILPVENTGITGVPPVAAPHGRAALVVAFRGSDTPVASRGGARRSAEPPVRNRW